MKILNTVIPYIYELMHQWFVTSAAHYQGELGNSGAMIILASTGAVVSLKRGVTAVA